MSVARRFALGLLSQDGAGGRVHVMNLFADRTTHRLIDVAVLRSIFGAEALNS